MNYNSIELSDAVTKKMKQTEEFKSLVRKYYPHSNLTCKEFMLEVGKLHKKLETEYLKDEMKIK